ncbi:transposase, partial [Neorhizobium galegae]|nr:transposase [Neorhizobium galegae]
MPTAMQASVTSTNHTGQTAHPTILEAACWAHARRKFFDLTTSGKAPIAQEALRRIGELYDIEKAIRGEPPDVRKAARQHSSNPKVEALRLWLDDNLKRLSQKSGRLSENS